MWGCRKPSVSEKRLGKGAKYNFVRMGFPWISLWTSPNWPGRIPIPVPSCLQGSKMWFSIWETSVQQLEWSAASIHAWQSDPGDNQYQKENFSFLLLLLCWNSWRISNLPEGTLYRWDFLKWCCIVSRCCAWLVPWTFRAAVAPQSTIDTTCIPKVLPRLIRCILQ